MTGRTHKAAGCAAMLAAYIYMSQKGYLLDGIHPIVQLAVMYPAASWGSTMPDLDQTSVDNIPDKTPVSIAVHKLLHIGKIKHRSWQTHTWAITLLFIIALYALLWCARTNVWLGSSVGTYDILNMLLTGFSVGNISHLMLDTLTYEGTQLLPGVWCRPLHADVFKTGTTYEKIVRWLLYLFIVVEIVFLFVV